MLSLEARFRVWKVMKGKYMSDIHQTNFIHDWILKRGKKFFMLLICELLIFFQSSLNFLEPTSEDIYSGGDSPILKVTLGCHNILSF